jgi:hypothetical protein
MNDWPRRPLDQLAEETQEAIAEDRVTPGPLAGDERDAHELGDAYERWLDSIAP